MWRGRWSEARAACCSRANCPNGAILRDSDTALVAFVPEIGNNDPHLCQDFFLFVSLFLHERGKYIKNYLNISVVMNDVISVVSF